MSASSTARANAKRPRRTRLVVREQRARSRLANGNKLFLNGLDGRSTGSRFYADRIAELVSMLGGPDATSSAELSLIRGIAHLELQREQQTAAAQQWEDSNGREGKPLNGEVFGRLVSRIGREMQRIGLRPRMRDVTPEQAQQELEEAGLA